ncbi:MAG TPA: NADP-dependent oxidoreductase [Chthoniobacterales bacterium]|nr:NADP-dependent oxidoreductase [Chthoniobacterales bacterium]
MNTKLFLRTALITVSCALNFAFAQTSSSAATMKAVVASEYGGPEVLKYQDVPRPEPKDDEILVRVMAAAVNPVDSYVRQGKFGTRSMNNLPLIIGYDISGVVEKAGANAKKFKRGDAVYCYLSVARGGGYAEFAIAKESETALKPKNISFEEAAAVPLAGTTAWQALIDSGKIDKGQTVLIHGGSGGVGSFAIPIAKARGAKVIATASTEHQEILKQLGVDQAIDYTKTKFEDVVKDVDLVLNCVRADALGRSYGVVKKGGIIVSITDEPDQNECAKRGLTCSRMGAHPDSSVLEELTKLIEAGKIKPIVSQTLPLADASKAHQQIETHHTAGKIVLKVAEAPK